MGKSATGTLRGAGLFSGIGGLELGLSRAGHRTLLLSEVEPAACAVLRHRFPDTPDVGDIRKLPSLPRQADLVFGGFPCQDLSQAGRTGGIRGSKSSVVGEVFRLLRRRRVPFVLLENVPFMLQLGRGAAIHYVVESLEQLGYRWAYRVIDSRSFGLPQRRQRVYLIASTEIDPASVLLSDDAGTPAVAPFGSHSAYGFYWTEGLRGLGWAPDCVPTLKGGSGLGIPSAPAIWFVQNSTIGTLNINDAERLQGFDSDWTAPSEQVARPGSRWKLVGNAVSVPAAEWIGNCLSKGGDQHLVAGSVTSLNSGETWPRAAHGSSKGRFAVDISAWPVRQPMLPIAQFLRQETRPLSRKATEGFLRRLQSGNLRYPPEFRAALLTHLRRMGGVPPSQDTQAKMIA